MFLYFGLVARQRSSNTLEGISLLFLFVPDTIDKILGDDDLNNNGYLSYYEFIESRLIDQQYQVIL